jgi:hypothetical protein
MYYQINSRLRSNYCSAQSAHRKPNPSSRQRVEPISKHKNEWSWKEQKYGRESRNEEWLSGCAGEGQQQFTALVCSAQASNG